MRLRVDVLNIYGNGDRCWYLNKRNHREEGMRIYAEIDDLR